MPSKMKEKGGLRRLVWVFNVKIYIFRGNNNPDLWHWCPRILGSGEWRNLDGAEDRSSSVSEQMHNKSPGKDI